MPNNAVRIGPADVEIALDDDAVSVPSLATLTFTACSVTPSVLLINDPNQKLSTSDTYQVMIGLVGRDVVNGGYTVGRCSPSSGNITIGATGDIIRVSVPNANWPSNFDKAICLALFLKINSANFQLAGFAYVDPGDNFATSIKAKPLKSAARFSTALLQSTTADSVLGSRDGKGITYSKFDLTTGVITITRSTTSVPVSPNNGSDYNIATSRTSGISFQSLINDQQEWVRAASGLYAKYLDGTDIVEDTQQSLNTAVALVRGNRPVRVTMPPDNNGNQEIRLMLGTLAVNQDQLTEAWGKNATTPVSFNFTASSVDKLLNNEHAEVSYVRRSG